MVSLQVSPDDGSRILPQAGTLWVKGDPQFLTQQLHFANAMCFGVYMVIMTQKSSHFFNDSNFQHKDKEITLKKDIRMITAAYILLHLKLP